MRNTKKNDLTQKTQNNNKSGLSSKTQKIKKSDLSSKTQNTKKSDLIKKTRNTKKSDLTSKMRNTKKSDLTQKMRNTKKSDLTQKINLGNSAIEHIKAFNNKIYTSEELALACIEQSKKFSNLSAFLRNLNEKEILNAAQASDKRRKENKILSPLDGIPISIKDNICQKGEFLTCSSKFLENYISPYNATVIEKLKSAGAILFGRTNMDEFAMGSSTENSAYQKTLNPWNENCVPGGSSGGAAVSVAACITPLALGSDTGGSVRQPASFCGVVGMRPTYGRVSRYGLVAFASSLDIVGVLAKNVADANLLLSQIYGYDKRDSTSIEINENVINQNTKILNKDELKKLKIGIILNQENQENLEKKEVKDSVSKRLFEVIDLVKKEWGAQIGFVKPKLDKYALAVYYILATAEASSNLGRFDGVRYGKRSTKSDSNSLKDLYIYSRTEGFGTEVKRRIMLGTFVLSSGYYDAYYKKAQEVRKLIISEYRKIFEKYDFIISPTSPFTAFEFGEKKDPLEMYRSDLYTIPSALANLPCINFNAGLDEKNLPIGLQIIGKQMDDQNIFNWANALENVIQNFLQNENPNSLIDYKNKNYIF